LATVFVDGIDANFEQVRSGFAWVYEKYVDQADDNIQANYWNAQETAHEQKRGLWSDTQAPITPWIFRHREKRALLAKPFSLQVPERFRYLLLPPNC
jgi:endonuclease YncB( thermonuclease family)